MSDTYSVELTFKQWMLVSESLGHLESYCRSKELTGKANAVDETMNDVAEELGNK